MNQVYGLFTDNGDGVEFLFQYGVFLDETEVNTKLEELENHGARGIWIDPIPLHLSKLQVVISGTLNYEEQSDDYYLISGDGKEYTSENNMLFEEMDKVLLKHENELMKPGDHITIIVERHPEKGDNS